MKKYVELSGVIENGMWSYKVLPGLEGVVPDVKIETIASIENEGFFSSKIEVASISGTYVESSSHMLKDGKNIDSYSIEDFIKPAKIVRLKGIGENSLIDADILERNAPEIKKGEALIVDTGWYRMWNKPGYVLKCPNYLRNALEWILNKEISILGVDVPCIEASWSEDNHSEKGSLLVEMFRKGVVLAAPLVNLDRIEVDSGLLYCFPMNVAGVSGAPARVVFEYSV